MIIIYEQHTVATFKTIRFSMCFFSGWRDGRLCCRRGRLFHFATAFDDDFDDDEYHHNDYDDQVGGQIGDLGGRMGGKLGAKAGKKFW